MEMEVMMPSPAPDFHFDSSSSTPFMSTSTTPYMSAPSSPSRIPSSFYSAPTSPSHTAAIPFLWESSPGTPKSTYDDADFAFDFSGHLSSAPSLPADELFHAGKIKPLKPPPRHLYSPSNSPKSPRKNIFSPRHKSRDEIDPFAAAIEHTTKQTAADDRRGRDRTTRNKGSSRSLSPFRVSDLLFEPESETTHHNQSKSHSSSSSVFSTSFWYKKWKIKDLLLFRSASESRAKDKDNMKQYSQLKKPTMNNHRNDDVRNSSFRSTESVGSVSSRRRTTGPPISAHELHYTVNRAFSEEMRRRTSLPYKQGLLGCLGFNPVPPEISKGAAASMPRV